jgi:hypothetical protein
MRMPDFLNATSFVRNTNKMVGKCKLIFTFLFYMKEDNISKIQEKLVPKFKVENCLKGRFSQALLFCKRSNFV